MMKLKFAALLAASALTFGTGAAMAAPQDHTPPKAEHARGPHHDIMDFNKDGFISRDEWMKAAAARFDRFDVSKDGKISREEMRFGRFEEMRRMGHRWHRGGPGGPHGHPGFGPGHQGPGGPGGPGHRMGPPPPPPADAPTPPAN